MLMRAGVQFLEGKEFLGSLRDLNHKGGLFQKAAKTIESIWGRAHARQPFDEVFAGIARTNNGEDRIPHCVKYDLTKFSRLVTVVHDHTCIFLFCGDHDTVDRWLEKNRGLDFVARQSGAGYVLEKARVSDLSQGAGGRIAATSDWSMGPLLELLPSRYFDRLIAQLPSDLVADLKSIESISTDDQIQAVALACGDSDLQNTVLDVLLSLKSGDVVNAKVRIDTWSGRAVPVAELKEQEASRIKSSESTVLIQDVDPDLFRHFVETASFEQWMLYLHPAQREYVDKQYEGPARLAGVSGSGKTCVVVHRALRLAEAYPNDSILVVTLSDALAGLIDRLMTAARGDARPKNIRVTSIFELCFSKLMQMEPHKRDHYTRQTIAKNPHAVSEDVSEIWREYFLCENNNRDADALLDVVQTLAVRGIYASDYLRQELDYIRSSFRPGYRDAYLRMERDGRLIPLTERFRLSILDGLDGWERKMQAVGVIDDAGIVTALARHMRELKAEYRCTLVDEVQDLGSLELEILRRLTKEGGNDLFLCGDAAQRIYTKHADLKAAGIELGTRVSTLRQNYRNSREILTAAHEVLERSLAGIPGGTGQLEVLSPEFASFSSPKPLLLTAESVESELAYAIGYFRSSAQESKHKRFCLAICGYSQAGIEKLGKQLNIRVLCATTDLRADQIFLSDLEQTKGFEFDSMAILNCSSTVMPHPNLPEEESFRDLSKLYVAMTRAKRELLVSYNGKPSRFVELARGAFVEASYEEHAEPDYSFQVEMPAPAIPKLRLAESWRLTGDQFLKTLDAVGFSRPVQDVIRSKVTGTEKRQGARLKQLEWKDFESFYAAMQNPRNRPQVVTEGTWELLYKHFG